jgi:predicted nuclease of predicted toxin-antitoxin system
VNIKLDENLPERLVSVLSALGHDVDTVHSEQLAGCDDADVWSAAQSIGRFLITQDLDFSDLRRYTPGTHAGLLLLRLAKPGRDALLERVSMLFATERVDEWRGCLVVATDRKVRVKRPA